MLFWGGCIGVVWCVCVCVCSWFCLYYISFPEYTQHQCAVFFQLYTYPTYNTPPPLTPPQTVTSIDYTPTTLAAHNGNILVNTTSTNGQQKIYKAHYVLVTVPLGVLKKGNITFTPSLPVEKQVGGGGGVDHYQMGLCCTLHPRAQYPHTPCSTEDVVLYAHYKYTHTHHTHTPNTHTHPTHTPNTHTHHTQGAINRLGMGLLDKVFILFPKVFWDTEAFWINRVVLNDSHVGVWTEFVSPYR